MSTDDPTQPTIGNTHLNPGDISSFNPQPDIPGLGDPNLNPGVISSFNPQPDIPGLGNPTAGSLDLHPGDASSLIPPGGGDPAIVGNPAHTPGDSSSFTPPGGGDPATAGNPNFHPGSAQGIIINSRTPDAPGVDVEGGQPHMDTTGGSGGTPTWSAPGNPDRGASGGGTPTWVAPGPPDHGTSVGLVIGIVLVLVLLLGGGGAVVAAKAGVFGCEFAAGSISTSTSMFRMAGDTCGSSNTGPLSSNPSATQSQTQPTATAPARATAQATATPRPTAVTRPTVMPKPTAVIPVPSISITQPANNATVMTSDGTDTFSGPITFRATASSGSGAGSVTVTWVDSVDGTLGTGATLSYSKGLSSQHNVNCGASTTHHVTAKAQNNLGGKSSATITVTITPFCHS